MRNIMCIFSVILLLTGCGANGNAGSTDSLQTEEVRTRAVPAFNADSAYSYVKRQTDFGPRVPNTAPHDATAAWLSSELKRHGAEVTEQKADLRAFDGTILKSTNIMGSFNPGMDNRLLLLVHYDTRPWADEDPDDSNHKKAIDGANDGASGVGVLLEAARIFGQQNPETGIDILFVDSEDYGTEGDDTSWALGARYFAENPIKPGYRPAEAILLDMVGGKGAVFPAEYFSRQAAPGLDDAFRAAAARAGHGDMFPRNYGGAVTDDHVELIKQGIPAIDIIDYRVNEGFCPTWHTMADNIDNIDKESLRAVGETLLHFIYR